MVEYLKTRPFIITAVSAITIFCLVTPVSALYLDFDYFETDKMVYEVGERIDMVAKLIADYDDGGWCYISFSVVTDLGPVYSDAYYISPTMDNRYFTSFYDIIPDDTSPGSGIATAYPKPALDSSTPELAHTIPALFSVIITFLPVLTIF